LHRVKDGMRAVRWLGSRPLHARTGIYKWECCPSHGGIEGMAVSAEEKELEDDHHGRVDGLF
jgi:hypothetical protein